MGLFNRAISVCVLLICSVQASAGGTGACCYSDHNCVSPVTQSWCDANNGVWYEGTACDDFTCYIDTQGACCIGTTCDIYQLQEWCESDGGIWQGLGSDCYTYTCDQYATGACCHPDGYCGDNMSLSSCDVVFGEWHEGLTCAVVNCQDGVLGACCYTDSCAEMLPQVTCEGNGGTWQGDGITCVVANCSGSGDVGACCYSDGQYCGDSYTQVDCGAVDGQWYEGLTCALVSCQDDVLGACCYTDSCAEVLPQVTCEGNGGTWQGQGSTCATVQCNTPNEEVGACCIGGNCIESLTTKICALNGGQWQGLDTTCASSDCSGTDTRGACCIQGGCLMEMEADCNSVNGTFYSAMNCSSVQCIAPCAGDLDNDGDVDVSDLLILIAAWGVCP